MNTENLTPSESKPVTQWHLIWVLGALVLAWSSFDAFLKNGTKSEIITSLGWLAWAFSWYVQPFRFRWKESVFKPSEKLPLNRHVSEQVWVVVTVLAPVLLIIGLVLKFLVAA